MNRMNGPEFNGRDATRNAGVIRGLSPSRSISVASRLAASAAIQALHSPVDSVAMRASEKVPQPREFNDVLSY